MHHGINDESEASLGQALQSQLQVYQERGFSVKVVHVDLVSAFMALYTQFPGVLFDIRGAKDIVTKIDSKMRRIKKPYQSVERAGADIAEHHADRS